MKKQSSICIAGGGSTFTPGICSNVYGRSMNRFPIRKIKFYDNFAERQNNHQLKPVGIYYERKMHPEVDFAYTTDPEDGIYGY